MEHPTCLAKFYEKLSKKPKDDSGKISGIYVGNVHVLVENILPTKRYELSTAKAKCIGCKNKDCSRETLIKFPSVGLADSNDGMQVGKGYKLGGHPTIEDGDLIILSPFGIGHSAD